MKHQYILNFFMRHVMDTNLHLPELAKWRRTIGKRKKYQDQFLRPDDISKSNIFLKC